MCKPEKEVILSLQILYKCLEHLGEPVYFLLVTPEQLAEIKESKDYK